MKRSDFKRQRAAQVRSGLHRGFSIVELVVATGVLVFAVYAIYDQFRETGAAGRRRLEDAQGALLAHHRLAELRSCKGADLLAWTPSTDWTAMQADANFVQKTEMMKLPDGLLEIRVTAGRAAPPGKGPGPVGRTTTARGVIAP